MKTKAKRNGERLAAWARKHKNDAKYRAARAEGSRRHLEQLYRDAELGRLAREFLAGIGDVLVRLAALKSEADGIAALGGARGNAHAPQDEAKGNAHAPQGKKKRRMR